MQISFRWHAKLNLDSPLLITMYYSTKANANIQIPGWPPLITSLFSSRHLISTSVIVEYEFLTSHLLEGSLISLLGHLIDRIACFLSSKILLTLLL